MFIGVVLKAVIMIEAFDSIGEQWLYRRYDRYLQNGERVLEVDGQAVDCIRCLIGVTRFDNH